MASGGEVVSREENEALGSLLRLEAIAGIDVGFWFCGFSFFFPPASLEDG